MFAELAPASEAPALAQRRRWRRGYITRRWTGKLGVAIVAAALATAVLGHALAPLDPFTVSGGSLTPPSLAHPMGTDALGRDVFGAVLYGARTSIVVASAVCLIALLCGTIVGMMAGYGGGWVDDVLMRITELLQVIPRFFFAIVAIALFGPGLDRMILTLGLTSWPVVARLVRGEVAAMRHLEFILAAEAMGATKVRIMLRELLPNVAPTVLVTLGLLFGQMMLLEATLSFLGLGDPDAISWGTIAAQAQGFLRIAWWLALFPGLAIMFSVLGVNLLADACSAAWTGR